MFGEIFSGVTLANVHGSGLPDFSRTGFTIPSAFADQCSKPPSMDCAAEATIYSHFVDPTVAAASAKSVEGDGMNGLTRPISNILTWLSQSTAQFTSPSAQILAGEGFGTTFTSGISFGCSSVFPPNSSDRPAGCSIPSTCTTEACIPVTCIPQACLAPGVTTAALASYMTFGNVPAKYLIPPEQSLYNLLHNPDIGNFPDEETRAAGLRAMYPLSSGSSHCHYDPERYSEANAIKISKEVGYRGLYSIEAARNNGPDPYVAVQTILDELMKDI